jgi:Flp pilus assembly protein TadD
LDRKLGRLNETAQHLRLATERGYDPAAIEREAWYADAQAGALALLESHLAELLITGDDAPEICEAFVHGCLLTYRLDDALRILKLWQADYPADPQPHYLRGRILEHRVDLEQAAVEYREALRLAPRHAPAAFNLGRVLLTQQHPAEALIQYQHCARDLYDPQPGLIGMARCLRLLGRFDEARQRLQQALESPRARLDVAYRLVGEPLEKAQAEAIAELGEVELAEEHYAEAEQHLRAGLAVNPHNWRVRYSLATTLRQQGKRDAAGEELRQVEETKQALAECDLLMDRLRRNPADVEARLHVGKVFLKYVSENQGLIWLQSVLTYNATHRETHRILAEYYAHREPESPEYKRLAEHHRRLAKSEPAAAVSEN